MAEVEELTERELEVAKLIAGGKTNPEIAAELVISEGTVKAHVHHILGKLEMAHRTEVAVWYATRQG